MDFVTHLAEIFVIALAVTFAVALLTRLSGSRPDLRRMLAIATGLIVAQAIRLQWSLSTGIHALAVGSCVALCMLVSWLLGTAKRER